MIKNLVLVITVCIFFAFRLPAQITVVENAASGSYPSLPGGSIAQGSMFVVYGSNLGATSNLSALQFPLPTAQGLLGTTIQVTSGSTTVDAIMIYTTPQQVAAVLPSGTPTGSGTLNLTYQGKSSSVPIQVVSSSFGAFTLNSAGSGPAIIQDYVSATELPINTVLSPAYPGQVVILWGTGLGPVNGDEAAMPLPGDMKDALGVEVWVGNKPATVNYAGRSGCCAAIDQVDFVVPAGIQGCYASVAVMAGGVISNFPSMAVAPSAGAACSDSDGIDSADVKTLQSAGSVRLGAVNLTHISLSLASGIPPIFSDTGSAVFGTYSPSQLSASIGLDQSPSVGSCTVSQFLGLNPIPIDPTKPAPIDAGSSLSITGPAGTQAIASTSAGIYSSTLGGVPLDQILTANAEPAYFNPGSYTLSGSGAIGSFSAGFTVPAALETNSSAITTIDRSKNLTIAWTVNSQDDFVAISGTASVGGSLGPSATSPGNVFLCIAPANAGTFTIPSFVLEALPSTVGELASSFLLVGAQTQPVKFSASGLDDGYVTYRSLSGQNVTFK